jgi:hypothetical protein
MCRVGRVSHTRLRQLYSFTSVHASGQIRAPYPHPTSEFCQPQIRKDTMPPSVEKKGNENEAEMIKPDSKTPKLDTSEWPILLKNYSDLLVRTSHFTPIPQGCSPLKRDIVSYVKCAWIIITCHLVLLLMRTRHVQIRCHQPRQAVKPLIT